MRPLSCFLVLAMPFAAFAEDVLPFDDCGRGGAGETRVVRSDVTWSGSGSLCDAGGSVVIEGDLLIMGALRDLVGLGCVCSVTGNLVVSGTKGLAELRGLERIHTVGGDLVVRETDGLGRLEGLERVDRVGGDVAISGNASLESTEGLDALETVGGDLSITDNDMLAVVDGIGALHVVGGDLEVSENDVLLAVEGLDTLSEIGGELSIRDNSSLDLVGGLSMVAAVGAGVALSGNTSLDEERVAARIKLGPTWVDQVKARMGVVTTGAALLFGLGALFFSFGLLRRAAGALRDDESEATEPEDLPRMGGSTPLEFEEIPPADREVPRSLAKVKVAERVAAWEHMSSVWATAGDVIIEQDDDPDGAVAWVIDGELEVFVDKVQVGRALPDELVGELGLFEQAQRGAMVRASKPTRLLVIRRVGYEALVMANNPVARIMEGVAVRGMGRKLRATARRIAAANVRSQATMGDAEPVEVDRRLESFASRLSPARATSRAPDAATVLRDTPVFGGLQADELVALASGMSRREFAAGKPIFRQGGQGREAFILASGRVDLVLATNATSGLISIDDLHPGDVFGFNSVFSDTPRAACAVALGPVVVYALQKPMVDKLLATDKPLGRAFRVAVVRALGASLREANGHLSGARDGTKQADFLHRARAVMSSRRR
jgi:CRP-like cAMP-binding protein